MNEVLLCENTILKTKSCDFKGKAVILTNAQLYFKNHVFKLYILKSQIQTDLIASNALLINSLVRLAVLKVFLYFFAPLSQKS